jgi:hypothetical protein
MDWSVLEGLLRCEPGSDQLRLIVIALGGLASGASLVGALYALWRWWFGRHRGVARALRQEAEHRARLNQPQRAMELCNLSIRLNGKAAQSYYLRGCLWEARNDLKRAIADWAQCLRRLPHHRGARQKLDLAGVVLSPAAPRWAYVWGAAAVLLLLVGIGTSFGH